MKPSFARLPTLEEIQAERARRRLSEYVRQAWPVIEPATPFLPNWHIDLLCEYLEAVSAGQITRLIINIPPRYMKSILVSVMWPTWTWIDYPWKRFLFASYSQSLSTKHSVDRRTIIQSEWYQRRWGDRFKLAEDQNLKTEFANDRRGHMTATSVGGTATGKGGDVLVVDDPVNPREAASDVIRAAANEWFDQTFYTRLDDKRRGAIVVIMQRLHEKDLTGHLLEQGGWELVKLPAIAEERTVIHFPISGRVLVREPGDILWPAREGPEELEKAKRVLGSYGFAGQYQQAPAPREGGLFQRSWFTIVKAAPAKLRRVRYWDLAATKPKRGKDPDWTVGALVGERDGVYYILDIVRTRDNPAGVERLIRQTAELDGRDVDIWMEQEPGAAGKITIDHYRRHVLKGYSFRGNAVTGEKTTRWRAFSAAAEAGNVLLVEGPWIPAFLEEIEMAPNGAHDDQIDAVVGAFEKLSLSREPRIRSLGDRKADQGDREEV